MADHSHTSDHSTHILPGRVYWMVYGLLMILLFITVWAAYMHIPVALLSIGLALTIAIVKATMVVLYFMHVKFQTRLTWLWAALGFIWLFLLFGVMMDYISRTWDPVSPGWTTTTFPGGGDPKPAPAAEPAKH